MRLIMRFVFLLSLFLFSLKGIGQSTASASVSHFEMDAPELGGSRRVWVYLPQGYLSEKTKKYPVLYMHDGQNLFDNSTAFAGEWNVDETLDSLKLPLIVVGIDNGGEKRIDELTPYRHEKYGGGKADVYLDFIVNKVKPKIEASYRTKPTKKTQASWAVPWAAWCRCMQF